ncbi:MAG TPA: nuclear transport factor 2 family protein [Burkholderiaceae bacterium]|nr:nuclear transport factor 2 family protein [Burkholderiaceae bacterium]
MQEAQDSRAVVGAIYAAFGRGDVEAIIGMLAAGFTWQFIGGSEAPYTGRRTTPDEVRAFFEAVGKFDEILAFEPREIIAEGEHVTVLGWERCRARPDGKVFEADWIHVFTIRGGKVARYWGMLDTEASMRAR